MKHQSKTIIFVGWIISVMIIYVEIYRQEDLNLSKDGKLKYRGLVVFSVLDRFCNSHAKNRRNHSNIPFTPLLATFVKHVVEHLLSSLILFVFYRKFSQRKLIAFLANQSSGRWHFDRYCCWCDVPSSYRGASFQHFGIFVESENGERRKTPSRVGKETFNYGFVSSDWWFCC